MKIIIVGLFAMILFVKSYGQKIIYGLDVDKEYPEFALEKEVVLKVKTVFYSVKIQRKGAEFIFSTIKKGFPSFVNPSKFYEKGLSDISKIFGDPITIFTDEKLTKINTDFYLWKFKRDTGYFFIYYCSGGWLTLNIRKCFNEKIINEEIIKSIYSQQSSSGRTYFFDTVKLNID